MSVFQSLILGLIQGLTEFIPVSSSAHLVIVPYLLGWKEPGVSFDVFLHLGTLGAVILFFWKDLLKLLSAFFNSLKEIKRFKVNFQEDPFIRLSWLIIIASSLTAIIGVTFKDTFERLFENPLGVACFLLLTGLLLWSTRLVGKGEKREKQMTIFDTLIVGFAQGCAIAPGISRSGWTIVVGLFSGLNKELAARFAFLLSIPAILGAGLVKLKDLWVSGSFSGNILSFSLGALIAMLSGYLAIGVLLKVLQKGRLDIFAYYCWALGLGVIIYQMW